MLAQQNTVRNSSNDLYLKKIVLDAEARSLSDRLFTYAWSGSECLSEDDRVMFRMISERLQVVKRLQRQINSYLATK